MYLLKKRTTLFRILRYVFFLALLIWVILLIFVFRKYIEHSSEHVVSKGGTFVEGIFGPVSFLPYLNNSPSSLFYQSLMFRSCLDYEITTEGVKYSNGICRVSTSDFKTYYASIDTDSTRSDGVPLSVKDIYFSYQNVIKENKFNIEELNVRNGIEVTMESDRVKVIFDEPSDDNNLFFTQYILPAHIIIDPNIQMYKQDFALEPTYNNCSRIQAQSRDIYSLIFDLFQCEDSNIGFYQLKKLESIDTFQKSIEQNKGSIIDAYIGENLSGYITKNLNTDKYVIVFFNTKSNKLPVRTRRALGGFIDYNLLNGAENNPYIKKYDKILFNHFFSTGDNLDKYFDIRIGGNISERELYESGVETLPTTIDIKGTENALIYRTKKSNAININMSFDKEYDKVGIKYADKAIYYLKSYNKTKKTANYIISKQNKNISIGANNYSIYGHLEGKQIKIASLSLYNISEEDTTTDTVDQEKINILYSNNPLSNYIVKELNKLFKDRGVSDNFVFEKLAGLNELEGKLTTGDYDIVIGVLDSSLRNDFYKFLFTDTIQINPSNYTNSSLNSLLLQHSSKRDNYNIIKEINAIYANDMPFVILGTELIKLNVREDTWQKITDIPYLHEYNRQNIIYNNLQLTQNVYLKSNKVWNIKNMRNFLFNR